MGYKLDVFEVPNGHHLSICKPTKRVHAQCTSFLDQSQEIQHFKMAAIKEVYTKNLAEAKKEVARRWPGSDRAHSIIEDFSKVSDWALKPNLEIPAKKYQCDFVQSFPILKRELDRLRKILVRRTRPRATLHNMWKSNVKRAIPREVFYTLEHFLCDRGAADDVDRTKCKCTITAYQGLEDIFR